MKTSSEGRPTWIHLEPKPPRVNDIEDYWADQPPTPSERCTYWVRQMQRGWLPNRRISGEGYYGAAEWYGVYLWEYLHVLAPLIAQGRAEARSR